MKSGNIICLLMIVLLNGCALSPQVINISPVFDTTGISNRQHNGSIAIMVNDARARSVIGSRGGVYSETAILTPADNMTTSIRDSLATALIGLGYNIAPAGAGTSLSVNITELSYTAVKDKALTNISSTASVNVSCRNRANTLNNDYRITNKKDFLKAPSQKENEKIINDALAASLNRIFQDDKLLACLDG